MNLSDQQRTVLECVQVNVPFRMLVESYLELFVKNGINPEIGIDADALDRFERSDFERVADALGACGARITMHGPFIDLSAGSKDCRIREVTRQRLQQLLEIAPLFNPVTVVCHAGYDAKRYDFFREVWIENSLVVWSWLAGELNRLGSRLMLENVYEKSPLELKVLLEGLRDHHVGLCLDTGHLWSFGRSSPGIWIDALGGFLGQFHLHDNDASFDHHLGLGAGNIDFSPVWQHIRSQEHRPAVVTLEPHTKKDLLKSLAYLEPYADLLCRQSSSPADPP